MPFKIHFLTCFSSDHNKISVSDANIVALYASSLRIKKAYFVLELFYFYKWCVTKVAHCIWLNKICLNNKPKLTITYFNIIKEIR